jgi:hypothetical protein
MQNDFLVLKYDGLLAANHEMDASDIHHAYEGAKRLLSVHASTYVFGRVPRNKLSETNAFRITARAPRRGSVLLELAIGIAGSMIYDVGKYTFRQHFVPAVKSWLDGREYPDDEFARIEPTLSSSYGNGEPLTDSEHAHRRLYQDVSTANAQAFGQITRPLGVHAEYCALSFDGVQFAELRRRMREWEITEAIKMLRSDGRGSLWPRTI